MKYPRQNHRQDFLYLFTEFPYGISQFSINLQLRVPATICLQKHFSFEHSWGGELRFCYVFIVVIAWSLCTKNLACQSYLRDFQSWKKKKWEGVEHNLPSCFQRIFKISFLKDKKNLWTTCNLWLYRISNLKICKWNEKDILSEKKNDNCTWRMVSVWEWSLIDP